MSDQDIARAQALGRAAARAGLPVTSCPYPWDGSPADRVLRMRWALAYAGAGGRVGVERTVDRIAHRARRLWYGNE